MQCVNCAFENMPGITTCARCGSSLELAGVGVEPPRASKHRVRTRLSRVLNPSLEQLRQLRSKRWRLSFLMPVPVSVSALAWTIIPGLGHLKLRQRHLGWAFLCIWLTLLLLAIICVGASGHMLCWNLAIATHVVAFVSLFAASLSYEHYLMRALFGVILFGALHLLVYQPIRQTCGQCYGILPVPNFVFNPVIEPHDTLLYQGPWLRSEEFQRGDLVVYRVRPVQGPGYYARGGFNVDRIIGLPGDRVQLVDDRLLVNGVPVSPEDGPLAILPFVRFEVTVKGSEYLIVPSGLDLHVPGPQGETPRLSGPLLNAICCVDEEDVIGRVLFRIHPMRRWGVVR